MKIIIPAYEPTDKLIKLVDGIQELTDISIIIVNDGSSKKCEDIFNMLEEKNVKVLRHEKNMGKGEALKTGIKYLIEIGETEGCICTEADGQHSPKDIIKVAEELKNSKKDLILGSRNFNIKGIPFKRKFGNNVSKILFFAMTGERILDTQTGLRGYSSNIFNWLLNIEGSRYEYEFNILLKLKEDSINYEEIKIEPIYDKNNKGSHFRPIKDSILIYKSICKFFISSITSTIIDFSLLLIFEHIFKKLLLSVVISRMVSSLVNFILNKNYVFERKSKNKLLKMIVRYYTLVIFIMTFNYLVLNLLYTKIGINLIIAKIATELLLYPLNFIMQRRFVFKKHGKEN